MPWKHIAITRLEVNNFKRFYGQHGLDLRSHPDIDKPIVLIGGNNGTGKTSLHEAINYALYEDGDLPGIQNRPTYLKAVSDRLNRRALDEGQTEYWVALELSLRDDGPERVFRIERYWDVDVPQRKAKRADLRITENARPIDFLEDETDPYAYQDFLRNLIPPQIAPFFFFDGERIQEFADDENHERNLVEAIEDILHISVYKQLLRDIKHSVVDHLEKHEVKKKKTDDFFKLQEDVERLKEDLEGKRERLLDIDREKEELDGQQKQIDDELRRVGGRHDSEREQLISDREDLQRELEEAKQAIHRGFEPLPLLLAGDLRRRLCDQISEEQRLIATPKRLAHLREQVEEVKRRVLVEPSPEPPSTVALSREQLAFYVERFDDACRDVLGLEERQACKLLHDVGEPVQRAILARLSEVEEIGALLREAINQRERAASELRDVETKIQSTSGDPQVHELIEKSKKTSKTIGALEEEGRGLEGEIQRVEADLATRQRQIEERQEQRKATTKAKQAIQLAQKARRVLDEFIKRLAPEKLGLLRRYMNEMYGRLREAENPVHSVEIDAQTWQVILKDDKGRPLEKGVFSAGMKEMYALSLLWALGRASGRQLPIVIDTPVARLDTTNRRALFEKYLPNAGHQVIVLSTDTEVDVQWAKRLAPNVARQFRLDYDRASDSTVIRPGYFF